MDLLFEKTIAEQAFPSCPAVKKVRLFAKRGECTEKAQFYYTVYERDAPPKTFLNDYFDPQLQNGDILLSYDGKYIFSPHYERGVAQISTQTGQTEYVYPARHCFSLLVTASSLVCLHRESRRRLVCFSLAHHQETGSVTAAGIKIARLSENCALCKKNDTQYMLVNLNNLAEHLLLPSSELCGAEDACFQIMEAGCTGGRFTAKYYASDPSTPGRVLLREKELALPPSMREFIERQEKARAGTT